MSTATPHPGRDDTTRAPRSPYTGHCLDCPTYDTLDASDCDCYDVDA